MPDAGAPYTGYKSTVPAFWETPYNPSGLAPGHSHVICAVIRANRAQLRGEIYVRTRSLGQHPNVSCLGIITRPPGLVTVVELVEGIGELVQRAREYRAIARP